LSVDSPPRSVLISFEGIDASGKNTQSKLLFEAVSKSDIPCEHLSFPDYSTPIGQEIENYLTRKSEYSPEAMHALYAANRYEIKPKIEEWIRSGYFVIFNRYCDSNIAYGIADGLPRLWLEALEGRMPQADYVVYLRVNPTLSLKRKPTRDRFEANLNFLTRVSEVYDALATSSKWLTIDGDREASIIHYEIVKTLSERLKEERNIFNFNVVFKTVSSDWTSDPAGSQKVEHA
jgi:dTMP kinase